MHASKNAEIEWQMPDRMQKQQDVRMPEDIAVAVYRLSERQKVCQIGLDARIYHILRLTPDSRAPAQHRAKVGR